MIVYTEVDITDSPIVMTFWSWKHSISGKLNKPSTCPAWLSNIRMEIESYIHWIIWVGQAASNCLALVYFWNPLFKVHLHCQG